MDMTNEIAIVTGAGLGMGRAIALKLARCGAAVLVSDKSEEGANETAALIAAEGGKAVPARCDVTVAQDIADLFQFCPRELGQPDILIANAGVSRPCPLTEVTEEFYHSVYDINTKGTLFSLKEAGLHLKDGGRIVVISSCSARIPEKGMAVYSSSKAAAQMMVEVAAQEFAPRGITVNSILPGLTGTPTMLRFASPEHVQHAVDNTPLGRLGQAEDIAEVAAFLASRASHWVTGQHILASGGCITA